MTSLYGSTGKIKTPEHSNIVPAAPLKLHLAFLVGLWTQKCSLVSHTSMRFKISQIPLRAREYKYKYKCKIKYQMFQKQGTAMQKYKEKSIICIMERQFHMMLENIRMMDDRMVDDNSNLVESINACRQGSSPSSGLIKSALSQTEAGRLKSCAAECSRLLSQVGIWHWRHLIQPQTQRISCLIDAILSIPLHSLPTFGPLFQMFESFRF